MGKHTHYFCDDCNKAIKETPGAEDYSQCQGINIDIKINNSGFSQGGCSVGAFSHEVSVLYCHSCASKLFSSLNVKNGGVTI